MNRVRPLELPAPKEPVPLQHRRQEGPVRGLQAPDPDVLDAYLGADFVLEEPTGAVR